MTKPFKTWYCDVCGEPIDDVAQGYVIWRTTASSGANSDFKIIHKGKCDLNDLNGSAKLSNFLGNEGQTYLLSKLSLGPIKLSLGQIPHCQIKDMDEFVDFFRRVQTPHYEEARRKFASEAVKSNFDDSNEVYPYLAESLKRIIEKY